MTDQAGPHLRAVADDAELDRAYEAVVEATRAAKAATAARDAARREIVALLDSRGLSGYERLQVRHERERKLDKAALERFVVSHGGDWSEFYEWTERDRLDWIRDA